MLFSRKQEQQPDTALPGTLRVHTMQDDLFPSSEEPAEQPAPRTAPTPSETGLNPFGTQTPAIETPSLEKTAAPAPTPASNIPSFTPLLGEIGPGKSSQESLISFSSAAPQEENTPKNPALIIIISVLIVALFAGGGYYFWTTRMQNTSEMNPSPNNVSPTPTPSSAFSLTSPNTLPILAESLSPQGIAHIFKQTATQVKDAGINKPVEFSLTDQDNNPLSFPEFATAAGINLSQEALSGSTGDFSLFVYNDMGRMRLALAFSFSDTAAAKSALKNNEGTLSEGLRPLFLDATALPEKSAFQESTYKNTSIRYFNLDTANALSIDYAFLPDRLVIATSKDTERAILDTLSK